MTEPQSDHAIRGRIGALESWAGMSKTERTRRTEAARDGWLQKLADEIDPEGRLSEAERMRAAEDRRRAHMLRISRLSKASRAKKAQAVKTPKR